MNFTQCSNEFNARTVFIKPLFAINSPNILKVNFGIFIRTVILPWSYNGADPLLQLGL